MMDLNNRVAIITGSGSQRGIGREIASTLSSLGAKVVIADMNQEGIDSVVKDIHDAGGKALGVVLDVTSETSVENLVSKTMEEFGRIDILVNNAGISQKVTVEEMTLDDMKRIFKGF